MKITSNTIRYIVDSELQYLLGENVTWTGTVTSAYRYFDGAQRRLLIDAEPDFWKGGGVWSRDLDCEIIQ